MGFPFAAIPGMMKQAFKNAEEFVKPKEPMIEVAPNDAELLIGLLNKAADVVQQHNQSNQYDALVGACHGFGRAFADALADLRKKNP